MQIYSESEGSEALICISNDRGITIAIYQNICACERHRSGWRNGRRTQTKGGMEDHRTQGKAGREGGRREGSPEAPRKGGKDGGPENPSEGSGRERDGSHEDPKWEG